MTKVLEVMRDPSQQAFAASTRAKSLNRTMTGYLNNARPVFDITDKDIKQAIDS